MASAAWIVAATRQRTSQRADPRVLVRLSLRRDAAIAAFCQTTENPALLIQTKLVSDARTELYHVMEV
jgi:hypothetical protein